MKKYLGSFIFLLLFSTSQAQVSKTDSLISKLTKKIAKTQYDFDRLIYPELAYIRRQYKVPNISTEDLPFALKLNDFYYKKIYNYRKLFNESYIITEDCISEDPYAANKDGYRLQLYSLYDNIPLPADYFKRLETVSKEDDPFNNPYYVMQTIYYLKRFHQNLNASEKSQLKQLEQRLSAYMYDNYVKDKPWSFRKLLSVKVLKINESELVKNIDMSEVIDYYLQNGSADTNIYDVMPFKVDLNDTFIGNAVGFEKLAQFQSISLLWIILIDKK
ncbi:MAG: hypothetical protein U0U67_01540 [Chitinophagales bacterium]